MRFLELQNVSKHWFGFALKDINLEIDDDEYLVLLGPTGAGKTLLLETIAGFHRLDKGRIILEGRDITYLPPEKRGFGYVPQDSMLFPHMNVRKNIEFGLKMHEQVEPDCRVEVDDVLNLFQLQALANRMPVTLSGGERQKVALARVLVLKPKLILLDEPLGSIDADARRELRHELKRTHSEHQLAVIHVTHDQLEGFGLAQRIAIMREGEIAQTGKPEDVFNNPKDRSIAKLLGYENIYEAKLIKVGQNTSFLNVNGLILEIKGIVESENITIGVRASDMTISIKPPSSGKPNTARGKVLDCDDMGSVVLLNIDIGFQIKAILPKREYGLICADQSREIWVSFPPDSVKIL